MITDSKTEEIIGKLVNISRTGLCLVLDKEYANSSVKSEINLSIGLGSSNSNIELEAELVWSEEIQNSVNYIAGFTYTVKNLRSKQRISALIRLAQF